MNKVIGTAVSSRYFVHQESVGRLVEAYMADLPEGMDASAAHVDMIRGQLHHSTEKASKTAEIEYVSYISYMVNRAIVSSSCSLCHRRKWFCCSLGILSAG